ncbi:hypothetical protein [Luteibacter sp. CQ10]|uniref:hypothetical protein n=1 Tax=Luteibacter sp. CQ10 TaxID=2805821 RepID=UPI0034A31A38
MSRTFAFAFASLLAAPVAAQQPGTAIPLVIGFDTLSQGQQKATVIDPAGHFKVIASARGPFLYVERASANMDPMAGNYLALRPGVGKSSNRASIVLAPPLRSGVVSFDYWVEVPGDKAAHIGCTFSNGHVEASWTGRAVNMGSFRCRAPEGETVREITLQTTYEGGVLRIDNIVLWLDRALAGQ